MRRLLAAVLLLVGGFVVGVATVFVHEWWPMLVVGLAACVAVLVALPARWWSRLPFVAGFTLVVLLGTMPRSEGDYLVGSDGPGYTLLVATFVFVVVAVITLPRRPRPASLG